MPSVKLFKSKPSVSSYNSSLFSTEKKAIGTDSITTYKLNASFPLHFHYYPGPEVASLTWIATYETFVSHKWSSPLMSLQSVFHTGARIIF